MGHGTTIFSIVHQGIIVIGADSLVKYHDGHIESFAKLAIVGSTVVACEGVGMITPDEPGKLIPYRADQWMTEIEPSLPSKSDAHIVARFIETHHPFVQLSRRNDIRPILYSAQHDTRKGYIADFLLASNTRTGLFLIRLRAKGQHVDPPDWNWRVGFEKTFHVNGFSPVDSFVRYSAGKAAEIDKAFSRDGEAYQEMLVGTSGGFGKLLDGHKVSLDELRSIVRCAIALEAKANPKQVGPPYVVATLEAGKPVSVTSDNEG